MNFDELSNEKTPSKDIFSALWKILLVILIGLLLIYFLMKEDIISFNDDKGPTDIAIKETSVTIKVGESYQLEATVLPSETPDKSIFWESINQDVASVNEVTGYVTALDVGKTVIIAETNVNKLTAMCVIIVVK